VDDMDDMAVVVHNMDYSLEMDSIV